MRVFILLLILVLAGCARQGVIARDVVFEDLNKTHTSINFKIMNHDEAKNCNIEILIQQNNEIINNITKDIFIEKGINKEKIIIKSPGNFIVYVTPKC